MASTVFRLLALSVALGQATAAFSLDTSGPSWDYTTKDLADTTSQACKDAYSASVNCDETLLKIVASMDPDFDPQSSDLQAMCTTTCSESLSKYIKNVKTACSKDGDLAGISSGNHYVYEAPVVTVGEVFQYNYRKSCAKSGSDYCYLTYPGSDDWAKTDFPCSDECAIKFFQNAHDEPGSGYFFSYFALGNQSSWWEDRFAGGWETVVQCEGGSDVSSSSTAHVSTNTDIVDKESSTSSSSSTVAISTTSTSTAAVTTTPVRSASETTSTTATSGASRLKASFFFF